MGNYQQSNMMGYFRQIFDVIGTEHIRKFQFGQTCIVCDYV